MTRLPLTREDFELIVVRACREVGVEPSDDSRIAVMNYFHSLERNEASFDLNILVGYLIRAYSNQMTFDVVKEIEGKRRAEMQKKHLENGEAAVTPQLSVVEPTLNS